MELPIFLFKSVHFCCIHLKRFIGCIYKYDCFPLSFQLVCLDLNYISCRLQIIKSLKKISSDNLCLLIGMFSPLTFNVIIDMVEFSFILPLCFLFLHPSFPAFFWNFKIPFKFIYWVCSYTSLH